MKGRLPSVLGCLGLLLVGALPTFVAGQSETSKGTILTTDPKGDVGVFFSPGLPAQYPENVLTNQVDLESLTVTGEDELGLSLELKVVSLNGASNPVQMFGSGRAFYSVYFKLGATPIEYTVRWNVPLPGPTETRRGSEPTPAQLYIYLESDDDRFGGSSYGQKATGWIDWDRSVLGARITKDALMGREPLNPDRPRPAGLPSSLSKGQFLSDFVAQVQSGWPTFLADRMPDRDVAEKRYAFQLDAANGKLRIVRHETVVASGSMETPYYYDPEVESPFESLKGAVSVTPGLPTPVPLRIVNDNAGKRLVDLSARLEDPNEAAKWGLQIVPTVAVPGGDHRVVNLIVNASAGLKHRDAVNVTVLGRSLGFSGELGAIRLTLVAAVPPGPDSRTLYFHARDAGQNGLLDETGCDYPIFFCSLDLWLNTLPDDPLSTLNDGIPMDMRSFISGSAEIEYGRTFTTDTPIGRDLLFDLDRPIEAALAFNAPAGFAGNLAVDVLAGATYVGSASTNAQFEPGQPVQVSFLPLPEAEKLTSADGSLQLRIRVTIPMAGAGAATAVKNLELAPAKSSLSLPIIRDPRGELISAVPLGPAFVTLQALGDPEEFVNPGRTKIFNATITNEGVQADEVGLTLQSDDPTWAVSVIPGTRFVLQPGESAKVGFLLSAPTTAQEGDQMHLLVNATSRHGGDATLSQLRLTAVVTTNIDIPDERGGFVVDEETAKKLAAGEAKKSPGLPWAGLLVAILVGLLVVSRRRFD